MSLDDQKPDQTSPDSGSAQPADDSPAARVTSGAQAAEPASDAPEQRELRTITDARTMRALSHPVRIAIYETLALGGPMTATEVGEQIDESPTTCSFHLRQLAKYGFVEEAGGGKGRARPWRLISLGFNIPSTHDDPEADVAATTLGNVFRERQLRRYRTWRETRSTYPPEWLEAADDSEYVMYLTVDELAELTRQLHDLLMPRFQDGRLADPSLRPPGSVPVELILLSYPMELPKADGGDEPGQEDGAR